MSISNEISRINTALAGISEAKASISAAITEKGVNVPANALLSEYPALINNISGAMDYDKETVYSLSLANPSEDFIYTGKMYNNLNTYEEGDELSSRVSYYYEPHSTNVSGGLTAQNILFSRYYSDRNLSFMLVLHFTNISDDTYYIHYNGTIPETANDMNAYEAIKSKNGTTLQFILDHFLTSTGTEYFDLPEILSATLIVNDEAYIVKKADANPNVPAMPPLKSDSGGGGDSGEVTYVYTVSGFTTHDTEANGNYWATGETWNNYPIYTNGNVVMFVNGISYERIHHLSNVR